MRTASLVLVVTLAACSGGGGGTTAEAQIAQYGPILQQCMELRTLDLLSILDDFAAILGGPPGPFERELDLDGDGDGDVTVSGSILDTGPGAREIDWSVTGAIAGSGVFSVTAEQDGTFLVAGDGMLSDSECDFDFEIEEATLVPPALAGAPAPCPGQRVGQYGQTASTFHRSSGSSMTGRGVWSTGPRCINNPQVTVPMGSGPWPPWCFGGCGSGGGTLAPEAIACVQDQIDLLTGIAGGLSNVLAAALVSGTLPPTITPVLGTAEDNDFAFQIPVASQGVTVAGTVFFVRNPLTGGIQLGDRIYFGTIQVTGSVTGSLTGFAITLEALDGVRIECEAAVFTLADCEVEMNFVVRFLFSGTTVTDVTGPATIVSLYVIDTQHTYGARLEFLVGQDIEATLVTEDGNPVPGTFTIPSGL